MSTRLGADAREHPLAAMAREFPGWEIAAYPGGLDVWSAERREGKALRYIVARTAAELAAKLETAETAGP
jgi:hypothetical protein